MTAGKTQGPEATSKELLLWLWKDYLRTHIGWLLLALLFMTLEGSMLGALSYMMRPMFDDVFVGGDTGAIAQVGMAVMGIFMLRAISGVVQQAIMARISLRTAAALRSESWARIAPSRTKAAPRLPGSTVKLSRKNLSATGRASARCHPRYT